MTREEIQALITKSIKDNKYSGVFVSSPRSGKTKAVLNSLVGLNIKILVISPTNAIIESWKQECIKWDFKGDIAYIHRNYLSSVNISDFDLIIKDECHLLAESEIPILRNCKKPIVAITGSLSKHSEDKLKYRLGLLVKIRYDVKDAVEDGIVSDYNVNVHYCELLPEEKLEYDKLCQMIYYYNQIGNYRMKLNYSGKRARLIYESKNKLIACKELVKNSKRVLVYSSLTKIANKLCRVTYHSKTKKGKDNLPKFQTGKINKLAAVGMLDMGITILNLKHAIIHQLQSVEERAIQRVLRVMNQENNKSATIDVFCVKNTVDEDWMKKALAFVPEDKIHFNETLKNN